MNDKLSTIRKTAGSALMKSFKSDYRTGDGRANLTNVTKALKAKGVSQEKITDITKILKKKGYEHSYKSFKIKKMVETLKKADVLKIDQSAPTVASHVVHAVEKAVDSLEKTSGKPQISITRNYAKDRRDDEINEERKKHGLLGPNENDKQEKHTPITQPPMSHFTVPRTILPPSPPRAA